MAHKMWTIFMGAHSKSKKIRVVLFGAVTLKEERDRELFKTCGFQEVLSETEKDIRKAQLILRERFCEQVSEEIVWKNIQKSRNIKAQQEFYVYFAEFLNQLRDRPYLKFRINEKTSRKIQENILNQNSR